MLFTCTLVRSHTDSNEGGKREIQSIWDKQQGMSEAWRHEMHVEWKARRRLSLSLDRGNEGHICEVFQEDSCSSMYKSLSHVHTRIIPCDFPSMLYN